MMARALGRALPMMVTTGQGLVASLANDGQGWLGGGASPANDGQGLRGILTSDGQGWPGPGVQPYQ